MSGQPAATSSSEASVLGRFELGLVVVAILVALTVAAFRALARLREFGDFR